MPVKFMETAFEKILTNSHRPGMEAYIIAHPESFIEAIHLAIADKQPYSWRAAWLLWSCMEKNDKRMRKYVKDIINVLPHRKDNQKRELLKILDQMEVKEAFEGVLYDNCVAVWEKVEKGPTIRFYALKILAKIAQKYPPLSREVLLLTKDQYTENLSPTLRKSINKIVKGLR